MSGSSGTARAAAEALFLCQVAALGLWSNYQVSHPAAPHPCDFVFGSGDAYFEAACSSADEDPDSFVTGDEADAAVASALEKEAKQRVKLLFAQQQQQQQQQQPAAAAATTGGEAGGANSSSNTVVLVGGPLPHYRQPSAAALAAAVSASLPDGYCRRKRVGVPELLGWVKKEEESEAEKKAKKAGRARPAKAPPPPVLRRPDAATLWLDAAAKRGAALEQQTLMQQLNRQATADQRDLFLGGSDGLDRLLDPSNSPFSSSSASSSSPSSVGGAVPGESAAARRKREAEEASAAAMAAAGEALEGRVLPVDGGAPIEPGPVNLFNGDVYKGAWRFGRRHGRGVYFFASGSRYEGEWKDGQMVGWGVYITEDGKRKNLRH